MKTILRNEPATGRWFLHLPDEPGNPVLIAETREAMLMVIEELKLGDEVRCLTSKTSRE